MDTKDNNLYIIDISILKEIGRKNKNYKDYKSLSEDLTKQHYITEYFSNTWFIINSNR